MSNLDRRRLLRAGLALAGMSVVSACQIGLAGAGAPPKVPRIGILHPGSPENPYTESIRQGLRELGYVEGQNISIEYRFADGRYERLPDLAAELVGLGVDVLVTAGAANRAARAATDKIPIVFALDPDPVGSGLVVSLARPGGNLTGLSFFNSQLAGKRLELLREVAPGVVRIAVLIDPDSSGATQLMKELEAAAQSTGVQLQWLQIQRPLEIPQAFGALAGGQAQALLVADDAMFSDQRVRLAEFAAASGLPAMFPNRGFADAGGPMAYGPNLPDLLRRSAAYVDKILKGARPADLPVEQPTTFDFVINLKTAQARGLTIPQSVLLQATEVI